MGAGYHHKVRLIGGSGVTRSLLLGAPPRHHAPPRRHLHRLQRLVDDQEARTRPLRALHLLPSLLATARAALYFVSRFTRVTAAVSRAPIHVTRSSSP